MAPIATRTLPVDDVCRRKHHADMAAFVKSQTSPAAPIGTVRPRG